jgi:hypothetical protein
MESGFNPIFCLRIIQVSLKAENIGNVVGYIRRESSIIPRITEG